MKYVLDTSVFLDWNNKHYPFEIFPTFWNVVSREYLGKTCTSILKVKEEIEFPECLVKWVNDNNYCFTGTPTAAAIKSVMDAAKNCGYYVDSALRTFANETDLYLVAYALENNLTVVSSETSNIDSSIKHGPKSIQTFQIPDVCNLLNIPCIQPLKLVKSIAIII